MKHLKRWIELHPFVSIALTFLFTIIAAIMAVSNLPVLMSVYAILITIWVAWFVCDCRRGLLALVAAAMLALPTRAEPPAPPDQNFGLVGIGVGVTVICVGGYCVIKIVKFCQKHFPKDPPTNSPPAIISQEMGAAFSYVEPADCDPDDAVAPVTFTLHIVPGATNTITASANHESQGVAGYLAEMHAHGLTLHTNAIGASYEQGRLPATSAPIAFPGGVVSLTAGPAHRVVVEKSADLIDWKPLVTVDAVAPFAVVDTTARAQIFYRVR